MTSVQGWWERLRDLLDVPLLRFGGTSLTVWSLLSLIVLLYLLFAGSGRLQRWVEERALAGATTDAGTRQAVGALARYLVLFIGLIVIVQAAGIDLTTFSVLAGAVGIGMGFGLQNIISNFISGLIILLERPIKIGDRIEVGNVEGDVVQIGARSTTVVTNDDIAIIVPNSKFITENVVNWSHGDRKIRFKIPVLVANGSDARQVERVLLDVAREHPDVLDDPAPGVRLLRFEPDGLLFELRAWTSALLHRRGFLTSGLNFAIYEKFREHGIELPNPKRDIYIRSRPPDMRRADPTK